MDITWYGHSCFRFSQRSQPTIITDPYDAKTVGYGQLKLKADIVTISHDSPGHNHVDALEADRILDGAGEYEIGGIFIVGSAMYDIESEEPRYNIVFVIEYEDIKIAHLGDLDHIPTQNEVDAMGQVDIALVPVGGGGALNASQAAEVISLLEPSIVIPMHYQANGSKIELDDVERFLREMGTSLEEIGIEDSLKITRSNLPEQTQIVVLAPKE